LRKAENGRQNRVNFAAPTLRSRSSPSSDGLYTANLARKVELHLRLWDEDASRIPLKVPERPLTRKVRRTWEGLSFYTLGEEDAFVFQALHVFQHILHNWCRLGWLLEIARFLETRSADVTFWKNLHAHLETNAPAAEVVALVTSLAATLFRAPLPAAIRDPLPGAMRGRVSLWVEQYGVRSALDNFSQNKYSLFLYREFVRDESAWRQIRRARLLPLHRPNRAAGAATPAGSRQSSGGRKQGWYVVQRLIHHAVSGAGYVWESARWERLRRQSADRVFPAG
jgi:hypothetical protein